MLRVALIGLGTISQIHRPIIESFEDVELVAVSDINIEKEIQGVNFYKDYKEMIEKEIIDVVHILLPHYLHVEATKACVEKGINVILEKPIGIDYLQAKDLSDFARAHKNVKIGVCLQNRLNNTTKKLLELKESERLGKLKGIKGDVTWFRDMSYYDQAKWRGKLLEAGSGVMINQAIHTIDLMYLLGGSAISIKGNIDNIFHEELEVEDFAYANIKYENDVNGLLMCTVANTTNSSVYLVGYFENGELIVKDNKLYIKEYKNEDQHKELILEDKKLEGSKFYYGASHKDFIKSFYDAVKDDTQDFIHVSDALEMHRIIDAIKLSGKENKRIYLKDLEA